MIEMYVCVCVLCTCAVKKYVGLLVPFTLHAAASLARELDPDVSPSSHFSPCEKIVKAQEATRLWMEIRLGGKSAPPLHNKHTPRHEIETGGAGVCVHERVCEMCFHTVVFHA